MHTYDRQVSMPHLSLQIRTENDTKHVVNWKGKAKSVKMKKDHKWKGIREQSTVGQILEYGNY